MKLLGVGLQPVAVVWCLALSLILSPVAVMAADEAGADAEWSKLEPLGESEETPGSAGTGDGLEEEQIPGEEEEEEEEEEEAKPVTVKLTGKVSAVDLEWDTLTVVAVDGKTKKEFEIGEGVDIKLSGKKAELADLKVKDEVVVTYVALGDFEVVKSVHAKRKTEEKKGGSKTARTSKAGGVKDAKKPEKEAVKE